MHSDLSWIPCGDFQPLRYRPGGIGNWSGHLTFAADLVAAIRPRIFVELGTHYGESYFGFCQAVVEHSVSCSCYAVDTWLGEEQAGFYNESVYREVSAYNDALYKDFSYLLRTTFDEAVENFADASIELLHIDGLHAYDAVSHDFHNWLRKVKPGGVVLLHDVTARHGDFGVWKLWEEIAGQGDRFVFSHSWGLGVFRKADENSNGDAAALGSFFHAGERARKHLQRFYALCALELECKFSRSSPKAASARDSVGVQVFPAFGGAYSLDACYGAEFQPGDWRKLQIDLSAGIGDGALRLDLAQQAGIIDIAGITIRKAIQDEILWAMVGPDIASLQVGGDMSVLESTEKREFGRFLSTGNDPQLYLPVLTGGNLDQPLYLEIWLRAQVEVAPLMQILKTQLADRQEMEYTLETLPAAEEEEEAASMGIDPIPEIDANAKAISECNAALEELKANHAQLLQHHETLAQEKAFLAQSHRKLQSDLYVAKVDLEQAGKELAEIKAELNQLMEANRQLDLQKTELGLQLEQCLTDQLQVTHARNLEAQKRWQLEQSIGEIVTSRSWRLTAPLRKLRNH